MNTASATQPNWDMTPYFSALEAADYADYRRDLDTDIATLRASGEDLGALSAAKRAGWASLLAQLEQVYSRFAHVCSYVGCIGAADSADEAIKREDASLAALGAELEKVFVAVRGAFKNASDAEFDALLADERLLDVGYFLRRIRRESALTMSTALEGLAADLSVSGISAWGRLYDRISGTLEFELALPDKKPKRLPVAMTRSFLEDADAGVRRAAQLGANAAWRGVGDSVAACLNAIAGTRLTLYKRRGIGHFLEPALLDAGIERATLDAMLETVRSRQSVAQRYLKLKAKMLGMSRLGFQDTMASLPDGLPRISWRQATLRVCEAFGNFYPALRELAERALRERWIDYEPRAAKRPGGFCSSSHVIGQSRVFMSYNGVMGDVQTLAHELGHAFHAWIMRDLRPWQCDYPMTLAETASTFAETLVTDAALESADSVRRRAILDHRLMEGAIFLCNIPMRFDFEYALYERRAEGELSVGQLGELMLEAQRQNFGDSIAESQLDPWYWASKLHFYITGLSFYNFPYTFGYLFSLGIFARAKAEGSSFLPKYELLLRATGSASAETIARQTLGIDLQGNQFWNESIDLIERDLAALEAIER